MSARDLVVELEEKGGILNILRDILKKINELSEEATKIWKMAFGRTRRITATQIGRYYALLKAQYSRARGKRKLELGAYLREFERIYNIYKKLDVNEIRRLVRRGSYVYKQESGMYNRFLKLLHDWIAEVWNYFMPRKDELSKIDFVKEIYNYIDKMILTVIDFSTSYVGEKPNPAEYEFILSCYIHIENYVHYSSEAYEPVGRLPIAIAYLIELMEYLAEIVDYAIVYPTIHIGNWEDTLNVNVISGLENKNIIENLLKVGQFGYDLQEDVAELDSLDEEYPSEFIVFDYLRGLVRRYLVAMLEWDFLKLTIKEIASRYRTG